MHKYEMVVLGVVWTTYRALHNYRDLSMPHFYSLKVIQSFSYLFLVQCENHLIHIEKGIIQKLCLYNSLVLVKTIYGAVLYSKFVTFQGQFNTRRNKKPSQRPLVTFNRIIVCYLKIFCINLPQIWSPFVNMWHLVCCHPRYFSSLKFLNLSVSQHKQFSW